MNHDTYESARVLSIRNPLSDAPVVYHPRVSSTMDMVSDPTVLRRFLGSGAGAPVHGLVAAAGRQLAGRGTHGRHWETDDDAAVLMTVVIDRPADWPFASIRFGLAVRAYAASRGVSATVKWPNDVMVDTSKLAGVLCEWRGGLLHVGVGVNVFASPSGCAAVSLREARASGLGSYESELKLLLEHIARYVDEETSRVHEELNACLYGAGKRFMFRMPDALPAEARVCGVDEVGGLIVETESGRRSVYAGRLEGSPF
ncbi:MAG: hypothetical protein EA383_06390 [Spirochaetaceae bacterium]|nr:MAG: hypothetical protein EA383_06390 [Spirochaetaceae bacterium]